MFIGAQVHNIRPDMQHMKHYLCDDNNSQHISFVKGQVLF